MMDINTSEGPTLSSESTLTATASSLQRLDDKLATGMTISDVAKSRWLTSFEVLQYLDQSKAGYAGAYPWRKAPPAAPPASGTLLLYNSEETPNYQEDGIEWIKGGIGWKTLEKVLVKGDDSTSDSSDSVSASSGGALPDATTGKTASGSSSSSSAMLSGASAEYLTCASRNSFHRREYRGPDNTVLLHYLDSVRALRMTSELVDRIISLSANAGAKLPPVTASRSSSASKSSGESSGSISGSRHSRSASLGETTGLAQKNLGDTMNILMEMVDEHDAAGTSAAEAVDEHILQAANEAAYAAVMKHIAPDEAMGVVGAMEEELAAMEDVSVADDIGEIEDVTAIDIDEAINQVLSTGEDGGGGSSKPSVSSSSESGERGPAEVIEDSILNSLEEVVPEELKWKLIGTTERMLDAAGVSLQSGKGRKNDDVARLAAQGAPGMSSAAGRSPSHPSAPGSDWVGLPLPEIVDVTPEFHVNGYQPLGAKGKRKKTSTLHNNSIVISTETPLPTLPAYVDQFFVWERYAALVDFEQVADDPQVRNVSFNSMTPLTPYSYKIAMPSDIPSYSVRHIVLIGVLLPKDHRVKRNHLGIELALKLTLQTEWFAAADLVGAYAAYNKAKKNEKGSNLIKGIRRPIFIAPCGGTKMQLLSQISKIKFTMYPTSYLPQSLVAAMSPDAAPNFIQRVAMRGNGTDRLDEKGVEAKRKRENYIEEFVSTVGIDAAMTTQEVDKQRKVRFVERVSNAITGAKGQNEVLLNANLSVGIGSDTILDGVNVDDMNEDEIDNLLGRVLMRYVQVCIERCATKEELLSEINWSGYAGMSLLHHACFYNFMPLITLLLNNGADTNIRSAEGDLTPLHFAASAGHREVVDVLIRHGCNPISPDSSNETPAEHAERAGHVEIAAMLSAYNEQAGLDRDTSSNVDMDVNKPVTTSDVFLQSAFKELSLKDKLGLNLFVDRSNAAPISFVRKASTSMITDGEGEYLDNAAFSFISDEDRAKLREAMSLASEMDLQEMNTRAEHQDVRQYLCQSNFEAISAASQALEKAKRKESDALKSASQTSDEPSKMQLSRALAMLVLRKNLPERTE